MSEDQNTHSEEGSFKEQVMKALEESRKKREEQGIQLSDEHFTSRSERRRAGQLKAHHVEKRDVPLPSKASSETKKTSTMIENHAAAASLIPEDEEPSIFEKVKLKYERLHEEDEQFEGDLSEEKNLKRVTRRKEDRVAKKIVYVLTAAIAIIAGILLISGYNYVNAGLKPLDQNDKHKIQVEIPSGSSNRQIGDILEQDQVIRDATVFNLYTKMKNLTNFQAGYYHLSANMSLDQISKKLQQGGSAEPLDPDSKMTVPEGYDIEKIGSLIAKKTKFKKADFIKLMKDESFFKKLEKDYPDLLTDAGKADGVRYRLEGYLFPATYNIHKAKTLEDLVYQMVDTTNQVMSPYYTKIKQKGMNVQEVLTLASLVEKEGVTPNDRKKIAQVFFNRIDAQMPIQSDISILYALGVHKELVTYKDTEVDSPYNLYTNTGYGPGPFDSPSLEAIQAVLEPEANDYYYFVADTSTGKVYYAKTYEQHMKLVDKYVNK